MDEFRYHMTLTGPLDADIAGVVEDDLGPHIAPTIPRPYVVDALTLLGEAEDGRFHQIHRYELTGLKGGDDLDRRLLDCPLVHNFGHLKAVWQRCRCACEPPLDLFGTFATHARPDAAPKPRARR